MHLHFKFVRERSFCREICRQVAEAHGTSDWSVAGFCEKDSDLLRLKRELRKDAVLLKNMTGSGGAKIQRVGLSPKTYPQLEKMPPL